MTDREQRLPFYGSPAWKHCRTEYAKSKNYLCEECLRQGKYNIGEIVHHIIPLTASNYKDASISLNPDNLMLLCRECHGKMHQGDKGRRYKVDELGRVII